MSVGHLVILRYFSREILTTSGAIAFVLLAVSMSAYVVRVLSSAADGDVSMDLAASMILVHIPRSLELILPLASTLGVLIVIGRLKQDSELAVLQTSGYSLPQLLAVCTVPVSIIAIVVAVLAMVVVPEANRAREVQKQVQRELTVFDTVVPGTFQTDQSGRLIYAERLSPDRQALLDVLIMDSDSRDNEVYLSSRSAVKEVQNGDQFLVLQDGYRYIGNPDKLDWELSQFERYLIRLEPSDSERPDPVSGLSMQALWQMSSPESLATLSWRFSLPLLCLLMLPWAFGLVLGNQRTHRLFWLVPVILIQFVYISGLMLAKQSISLGYMGIFPGLLWVHAAVIAAGLGVLGVRYVLRRWLG